MTSYTVSIQQSSGSTVVATDLLTIKEARRVARVAFHDQPCRWVMITRDPDGKQWTASQKHGRGLLWQ